MSRKKYAEMLEEEILVEEENYRQVLKEILVWSEKNLLLEARLKGLEAVEEEVEESVCSDVFSDIGVESSPVTGKEATSPVSVFGTFTGVLGDFVCR